jgi:hypothetical protein
MDATWIDAATLDERMDLCSVAEALMLGATWISENGKSVGAVNCRADLALVSEALLSLVGTSREFFPVAFTVFD